MILMAVTGGLTGGEWGRRHWPPDPLLLRRRSHRL